MSKHSVTKIFGGKYNRQFVVHAYNIITTDVWVVRAYELADNYSTHGTTCRFDEFLYGDVTTRRTQGIEGLPVGDERTEKVQTHYRNADKDARELIFAVFPTIAEDSTCWNRANDCADITVHGKTFNHTAVENPQIGVKIW